MKTKAAAWETAYGKIVSGGAVLGVLIACTGAAWHLLDGGSALVSPADTIGLIWAGHPPDEIWRHAGKEFVTRSWWYVLHPGFPEAVCLMGASITALAAVLGMWGAAAAMASSAAERKKPASAVYLALAVLIALLLTLNAAGIFGP